LYTCECSDLCTAPGYQQNKFGDEFRVFLLINPEDEQPVAVVVPRQTVEPVTGGNTFFVGARWSEWSNIFPKCQLSKYLHYYVVELADSVLRKLNFQPSQSGLLLLHSD
jgi:hypothetical protein